MLSPILQGRRAVGLRAPKRKKFAPVRPDRSVERYYLGALLIIVRHIAKVTQEELGGVLKLDEPLYAVDAISTNVGLDIESALNKARNKIGSLDAVAEKLAANVVNKNLMSVNTRLATAVKRGVGVDVSHVLKGNGKIAAALKKATKANVDLIKSIPDQYLEKVRKAVYENVSAGMRFEGIEKLITHVGDVTESRAKLIARDQTSKMNGAFNRIQQVSLGIDRYQWQTAGDERVRETHAENDGKIFYWDDPPEETGNPGDDVECRCFGIPIFVDEDAQ